MRKLVQGSGPGEQGEEEVGYRTAHADAACGGREWGAGVMGVVLVGVFDWREDRYVTVQAMGTTAQAGSVSG